MVVSIRVPIGDWMVDWVVVTVMLLVMMLLLEMTVETEVGVATVVFNWDPWLAMAGTVGLT